MVTAKGPSVSYRRPNKIHRLRESAMSETRERVHIEDGPKRVRTYLGGELIADTRRLKLVWEVPYYPAYYFPREDVRMELLMPNGHKRRSPSRGDAHIFTLKGGNREVEDAAWHYPESSVEELRDLIRFEWNAMMDGSRRTRRSLSTHATPTSASTSCTAPGTSRSR